MLPLMHWAEYLSDMTRILYNHSWKEQWPAQLKGEKHSWVNLCEWSMITWVRNHKPTPSSWHPCMWPTGQRCRVNMCCWPLARNGCTQERMFLSKRETHCLQEAWVNIQTQMRVRHCFASGIASSWRKECCMWTPHLKARPRDCWPLLFPPHIDVQLSMACTKMLDTKVSNEC